MVKANEEHKALLQNFSHMCISHYEEMQQQYSQMMDKITEAMHHQIDLYIEKLEDHLDSSKDKGKEGASLMLESAVEGVKRVKSHINHHKEGVAVRHNHFKRLIAGVFAVIGLSGVKGVDAAQAEHSLVVDGGSRAGNIVEEVTAQNAINQASLNAEDKITVFATLEQFMSAVQEAKIKSKNLPSVTEEQFKSLPQLHSVPDKFIFVEQQQNGSIREVGEANIIRANIMRSALNYGLSSSEARIFLPEYRENLSKDEVEDLISRSVTGVITQLRKTIPMLSNYPLSFRTVKQDDKGRFYVEGYFSLSKADIWKIIEASAAQK